MCIRRSARSQNAPKTPRTITRTRRVARTASTCHYRTGRAHSCSHSSCWWWCDGECSCDPHCCPRVALGEGRGRDRRRPVRAQRLGLMERCSKQRVVSAVEFARWIRTRPDQCSWTSWTRPHHSTMPNDHRRGGHVDVVPLSGDGSERPAKRKRFSIFAHILG